MHIKLDQIKVDHYFKLSFQLTTTVNAINCDFKVGRGRVLRVLQPNL
jgi:hypothetical protein